MQRYPRAIVIVLDGVGVGALPDADAYGDAGSDTLGHIAGSVPLRLPVLRSLGLDRVARLGGGQPFRPVGASGKMAEASPGKDSVTGHWELMGVVLEAPFPVFAEGFPDSVVEAFARETGRGVIGNRVTSGTHIIEELGAEHLTTGAFIVYTSADSVFQVAAHEDAVPLTELYDACAIAFRLVCQGLGVGRVIARPFVGSPGAFRRTSNRRDFVLPPAGETFLDRARAASLPVVAIGKIEDLFAGRGVSRSIHTSSDAEGMDRLREELARVDEGFFFVNLVDFDTQYGHRNDISGYARNLEQFDRRLADLLSSLHEEDLLVVTADHGNDPTTPSTDHSREYVPLLVAGSRVNAGVDLGVRHTFADVGQTLAENFGVGSLAHGTSFLEALRV